MGLCGQGCGGRRTASGSFGDGEITADGGWCGTSGSGGCAKWREMLLAEYPDSSFRALPFPLVVLKNRWFRLGISCWSCLNVTLAFLGWMPMAEMLFADGTFADRCETPPLPGESCDPQFNAVQSLYTISLLTSAVASLPAGIVLDSLGPMRTGIIGVGLYSAGLAFIALARVQQMLLYVGFALYGFNAGFAVFPLLEVRNQFPNHQRLVISLLSACTTLSTVVNIILNQIKIASGVSLNAVVLGYLVIIVTPTSVIFVLSLPYFRATPQYYLPAVPGVTSDPVAARSESRRSRASALSFIPSDLIASRSRKPSSSHSSDSNSAVSAVLLHSVVSVKERFAIGPGTLDDELSPASTRAGGGGVRSPFSDKSPSVVTLDGDEAEDDAVSLPTLQQVDRDVSALGVGRDSIQVDAPEDVGVAVDFVDDRSIDWKTLGKEVCTVEFIAFMTYYTLTTVMFGYYATTISAAADYGPEIARFIGFFTPSQAVWGLLLGLMVARFGTLSACSVLVCCSVVIFSCVEIYNRSLQYFIAVLEVFAASFMFSSRFCWINETFHLHNYGSLIGISGIIPAPFFGLNLVLNQESLRSIIYKVYLGTCLLSGGAVVWLWIRKSRGINGQHLGQHAYEARRAKFVAEKRNQRERALSAVSEAQTESSTTTSSSSSWSTQRSGARAGPPALVSTSDAGGSGVVCATADVA